MSKKIVILNGSPRVNGNTSGLIDAFTAGAEKAGHTVARFDLQQMNIHPCLGCYNGGKDPESPCTQKDDMDIIYPFYKEADIVVLASPLYFWTISGQLKVAIDRLFATAEAYPNHRVPPKGCVLLMAAEGRRYGAVVHYYQTLLEYLGWQDLGQVLAGGVQAVGDIAGHPSLEEAKMLGASIA